MTYRWIKKGLVFKPTDHNQGKPWLNAFAQGPATLILEDRIRTFFSCRPPADENGQFVSHSAYVDFSRKNFPDILGVAEQPVMPMGERGCFDEFGVYPFSIAPKSDQELFGFFGGWTRCESVPFNVAIGAAISKDNGKTFERLGQGPIIPYSYDEPFIMSGPKIRKWGGKYFLYYIAGKKWFLDLDRVEPVYRIRMAISDDGINWQKIGRDLIPTKLEDDECQASPDVIFLNGKYHMFFCYRYSTRYKERDRSYRIGYATSSDALNWKRADDQCGLDISESGDDYNMVAYPHIFELDGKIYMFYLGNDFGREGFCLAELDGDLK